MSEVLKIVFGSIFELFLPGFVLTWLFFPKKNEIDWLERIALAFGLSIVIVPLTVFYLNYLFEVKINVQNVTLIIIFIIIIGFIMSKKSRSKNL